MHVETIGGDKASLGTAESLGSRGNAKASLERYRQVGHPFQLQRVERLCVLLVKILIVALCMETA